VKLTELSCHSPACSEEVSARKTVLTLQRITQLCFPLTGKITGKAKQFNRGLIGITPVGAGVRESQVASCSWTALAELVKLLQG